MVQDRYIAMMKRHALANHIWPIEWCQHWCRPWMTLKVSSAVWILSKSHTSNFNLECGPMPKVMAALPNIGGALCWTPQFGWRPLLECRVVTLLIQAKRTQDLDTKWILHVVKFRYGARAPENVYTVYQSRRWPNIVQSLVTSVQRRGCSNKAKTRNQLKSAGVPQSCQ